MTEIHLVSGGLDSFIAYKLAYAENQAIISFFIDYGQPYAKEEMVTCKELFPALRTLVMMPDFEVERTPFIPARNLQLAAITASIFNPDRIHIAGLRDDRVEDKNPEAFKRMTEIISQFSRKKVEVFSNHFHQSKGQLTFQYLTRFESRELLKTFSCYEPKNGKPCRNCGACLRWWSAITSNKVDVGWNPKEEVIKRYVADFKSMDPDRRDRLIYSLNTIGKKYSAR